MLHSASDWLEQMFNQSEALYPVLRVGVVTHQYGISVLVPQAGTGICTSIVLFNIEVNIISQGKIVEDGLGAMFSGHFPGKGVFKT